MQQLIVTHHVSGDYHILGAEGLVGQATFDEMTTTYMVWLNYREFFAGKVARILPCDDRWRVEPEPGHEMSDDQDMTYANLEDALRACVVALLDARQR